MGISEAIAGYPTLLAIIASAGALWSGCQGFTRGNHGIAISWWIIAIAFILVPMIDPVVHDAWSRVILLAVVLVAEMVLIFRYVCSLL
jgi:hypothetical protein